MLTIRDLKVHYGEFKALDMEGEFTVYPGDKVGIIGANGAGKTTFIKACLRLVQYQGKIETNISINDMVVHLQSNEYVDTMPCGLVMETILNTSISKDEKLGELIQFFDMEKHLKKKYKYLSGGQKQRFTLIMVLYQDAKITFFDEVTTGLDFETRESLMDLINDWYRDKKSIVFLVTHYYEELEQMANKLMIIDEGKMIDYGDKDELFRQYCGYSLITLKNSEETKELVKNYTMLSSPKQTIALRCKDLAEEKEIAQLLTENNVNYKRSNNDVEIMSLNAIQQKGGITNG